MALSIEKLQEALTEVTTNGGAWGQNMHPSKDVKIRVGDAVFDLSTVSASFMEGSFVLVLDAG